MGTVVKRRKVKQAKGADRLGPKGKWAGSGVFCSPDAEADPAAERQYLTHPMVSKRNVVSPNAPQSWERKPQGDPMRVRVKEDGKSEGWPVMVQIRVELTSNITRRESEQTSIWSFITREFVKPSQGRKADGSHETNRYGGRPVPSRTVRDDLINWCAFPPWP